MVAIPALTPQSACISVPGMPRHLTMMGNSGGMLRLGTGFPRQDFGLTAWRRLGVADNHASPKDARPIPRRSVNPWVGGGRTRKTRGGPPL